MHLVRAAYWAGVKAGEAAAEARAETSLPATKQVFASWLEVQRGLGREAENVPLSESPQERRYRMRDSDKNRPWAVGARPSLRSIREWCDANEARDLRRNRDGSYDALVEVANWELAETIAKTAPQPALCAFRVTIRRDDFGKLEVRLRRSGLSMSPRGDGVYVYTSPWSQSGRPENAMQFLPLDLVPDDDMVGLLLFWGPKKGLKGGRKRRYHRRSREED